MPAIFLAASLKKAELICLFLMAVPLRNPLELNGSRIFFFHYKNKVLKKVIVLHGKPFTRSGLYLMAGLDHNLPEEYSHVGLDVFINR